MSIVGVRRVERTYGIDADQEEPLVRVISVEECGPSV